MAGVNDIVYGDSVLVKLADGTYVGVQSRDFQDALVSVTSKSMAFPFQLRAEGKTFASGGDTFPPTVINNKSEITDVANRILRNDRLELAAATQPLLGLGVSPGVPPIFLRLLDEAFFLDQANPSDAPLTFGGAPVQLTNSGADVSLGVINVPDDPSNPLPPVPNASDQFVVLTADAGQAQTVTFERAPSGPPGPPNFPSADYEETQPAIVVTAYVPNYSGEPAWDPSTGAAVQSTSELQFTFTSVPAGASKAGTLSLFGVSATFTAVDGLDPATYYTFEVTATNAYGTGPASTTDVPVSLSAGLVPTPAPPTDFLVQQEAVRLLFHSDKLYVRLEQFSADRWDIWYSKRKEDATVFAVERSVDAINSFPGLKLTPIQYPDLSNPEWQLNRVGPYGSMSWRKNVAEPVAPFIAWTGGGFPIYEQFPENIKIGDIFSLGSLGPSSEQMIMWTSTQSTVEGPVVMVPRLDLPAGKREISFETVELIAGAPIIGSDAPTPPVVEAPTPPVVVPTPPVVAPTPPVVAPTPPVVDEEKSGLGTGALIGVIAGTVAVVTLAAVLTWYFMRRAKMSAATRN